MNKTIFDLELYETLMFTTDIPLENGENVKRKFYVTRVSGGWIYKRVLAGETEPSVFIPYNEELKPSKYETPQDEIYV